MIKQNKRTTGFPMVVGVVCFIVALVMCITITSTEAYADEYELPGKALDGCVVELSPAGYLRSVSVENDGVFQGDNLHLWHLGTASKVKLTWDSTYRGYHLENYRTFHEGVMTGLVWDIEDQKKDENAWLHVWQQWSEGDVFNRYTGSQVWKFYKNEDGTYYIKNALSNKRYISLINTDNNPDEDNPDRDGSRLRMRETPFKWNLEIIAADKSIFTYSSYADALNWMRAIEDDTLLSEISIPGTHDTGTANVIGSDDSQTSQTQTQKYYFDEQLAVGVRAFDLRLGPDLGTKLDPVIHHGDFACLEKGSDSDIDYLHLSHVINEFETYLADHPTETIIALMAKANDSTSESNITKSLEKHLKEKPELFWDGVGVPTLGEARGKIVLMHRINLKDNTLDKSRFGLDLTKWNSKSSDDFKKAGKAMNIYNVDTKVEGDDPSNTITKNAQVWVQDYYDGTADDTIGAVRKTLDQAESLDETAYLFNFTSCTDYNPFSAARSMNRRLATNSHFAPDNKEFLGIVAMDFIDANWCRKIYMTNYEGTTIPEYRFPTSATLNYGQKLSEAVLHDYYAQESEYFRFKKGDLRPSVEDAKTEKYTVELVRRVQGGIDPILATKDITVEVIPQSILVQPESLSMEYGTELGEFGYCNPTDIPLMLVEGRLVSGDKLADLKVRAFAIDESGNPIDDKADVGTYDIATNDSSEFNENYSITVNLDADDKATYTIKPRVVEISWQNYESLLAGQTIEGSVSASISNSVVGDDCGIDIGYYSDASFDEPATGTYSSAYYWAHALALSGQDSANYTLIDTHTQTEVATATLRYFVRASKTEVVFPDEVRLVYGQNISQAVFVGGAGDGAFELRAVGGSAPRPNAGHYVEGYRIWFTPSNGSEESQDLVAANLRVFKKPLHIKALIAASSYGSALASLNYEINESDLADPTDLDDITIALVAKDAEGRPLSEFDIQDSSGTSYNRSPVGLCRLALDTAVSHAANYQPLLRESRYIIMPRIVSFAWENHESHIYTGKPAEVKAAITNLVPLGVENGVDDCSIELAQGDKTDVGHYRAFITSLSGVDSSNYRIPSGLPLFIDYEIMRATPSVVFPTKAGLTYGQTLGQAITDGTEQSEVAGSFSFSNDSLVPNEGTRQHLMRFSPENTRNYHSVWETVDVEVVKADSPTPVDPNNPGSQNTNFGGSKGSAGAKGLASTGDVGKATTVLFVVLLLFSVGALIIARRYRRNHS